MVCWAPIVRRCRGRTGGLRGFRRLLKPISACPAFLPWRRPAHHSHSVGPVFKYLMMCWAPISRRHAGVVLEGIGVSPVYHNFGHCLMHWPSPPLFAFSPTKLHARCLSSCPHEALGGTCLQDQLLLGRTMHPLASRPLALYLNLEGGGGVASILFAWKAQGVR
jgi:hypothetical protein